MPKEQNYNSIPGKNTEIRKSKPRNNFNKVPPEGSWQKVKCRIIDDLLLRRIPTRINDVKVKSIRLLQNFFPKIEYEENTAVNFLIHFSEIVYPIPIRIIIRQLYRKSLFFFQLSN